MTSDVEATLAEMKEQMGVLYSLPGLDNALVSRDFDVVKIVEELRRATRAGEVLSRGGWSREFREAADYGAVRRIIPDKLASQVAVVGSGKEIRRRLSEYQELEVTHVFVPVPEGPDADKYAALLKEIRP